jgi:dTDP-4-amino-4,6-dideoxygalactose transaminase
MKVDLSTVTLFERQIADFFGAPYAVAVDSCTHGIELALRYTNAPEIFCPKRTYLSIPFLAHKLNIKLNWKDENWVDYYYLTSNVIDAAVLWKPKSYIPDTFMGISFQFQKHLNLGRGGILLTGDEEDYKIIKKMSYDGRLPDIPWRNQNINTIGYHYYMPPETARLGIEKLPDAIKSTPRQWTLMDWPDLSKMDIFRKFDPGLDDINKILNSIK